MVHPESLLYSALNQDNTVREELKTPSWFDLYQTFTDNRFVYPAFVQRNGKKNLIGLYTIHKRGLTSIIMGMSNYYFPLFEEALERLICLTVEIFTYNRIGP